MWWTKAVGFLQMIIAATPNGPRTLPALRAQPPALWTRNTVD